MILVFDAYTPLRYFFLALGLVAFVAAAIYLTDVRPKVKDFPKNRSSSGPYGPW